MALVSYRRVGGLRFLKIGRITITIACTAKGSEARKRKSRKAIKREIKASYQDLGYRLGFRHGMAEIASRHRHHHETHH